MGGEAVKKRALTFVAGLVAAGFVAQPVIASAQIRVGIVGTDTSHVVTFTRILNDPSDPEHVSGARVVAAYKGPASQDLPYSRDRNDRFAAELQSTYGVELVSDIATLCAQVDAILLESVDGRVHLAQMKEIIAAGKPVYIEKPLAASLADAREIARLSAEAGVPWFSASGLRFRPFITEMKFPDTTGAVVWGPRRLEENVPLDLSYYGIHSIEALYTLLGPGCTQVTRTPGQDTDVVVGRWADGRTGTVYLTSNSGYGGVVFRSKEIVRGAPQPRSDYAPLVRAIVTFFQTRRPPVSNAETLEIIAFMDAAQRSKAAGGQPMALK